MGQQTSRQMKRLIMDPINGRKDGRRPGMNYDLSRSLLVVKTQTSRNIHITLTCVLMWNNEKPFFGFFFFVR